MEPSYHDSEIFISAYDKHAGEIFRYCLFRLRNKEAALDMMQETFTKTWEYIAKGGKVSNLRAFLYRVAHNACVNEALRAKPVSLEGMREEFGFDVRGGEISPEDNAEALLLINKMESLSPTERELLTMKYLDDLKVSEIAEILGMLPNTVSVKLRRAEEALRKISK